MLEEIERRDRERALKKYYLREPYADAPTIVSCKGKVGSQVIFKVIGLKGFGRYRQYYVQSYENGCAVMGFYSGGGDLRDDFPLLQNFFDSDSNFESELQRSFGKVEPLAKILYKDFLGVCIEVVRGDTPYTINEKWYKEKEKEKL